VGTALPVVAFRVQQPILTAVAAFAFIALQASAAGYLLIEARRRHGPGAVRMALASGSTATFAAALLVSMVGSGQGETGIGAVTATVMAVIAGLGYLVAFVPPALVREIWQARTTVDYMRDLIARSREPVPPSDAFTDMAVRMQGGSAILIAASGTGNGSSGPAVVAATAVDEAVRSVAVDWPELEALVGDGRSRWDVPVADVGSIRRRLAEITGARFVSVVPIALPDRRQPAALILLSHHRALFHASTSSRWRLPRPRSSPRAGHGRPGSAHRRQLTVEDGRQRAKSDFVPESRIPDPPARSSDSESWGTRRRDVSARPNGSTTSSVAGSTSSPGQRRPDLRVEAGRLELHPEPIDVGSAVTEAVNGLRPLADRKSIVIESAVPAMIVSADRGRFRQILYNLVSNAIKYTPDGGIIRVAALHGADEVRIAVIDNGVGIDPQDHARVFEEFRQVGDLEKRQPGTGLGLAVTKRLAEAHDGRIELESARGQGSTFTLVLPTMRDAKIAQPELIAASSAASAIGMAITSGDVLVIEDDPSAVRLLREYLEAAGYSVQWRPPAIGSCCRCGARAGGGRPRRAASGHRRLGGASAPQGGRSNPRSP
jgi:anti-sigma regulatory factor (Ser/Thr protein kinase)